MDEKHTSDSAMPMGPSPAVRMNWNPEKIVLIDLETQSTQDISKVGSLAYVEHPSTRLMCLVAKIGSLWLIWVPPGRAPSWYAPAFADFIPREMAGENFALYRGADIPHFLFDAIAEGQTFVAHNAIGFDAPAYAKLVGGPQPEWYDTIPCARAAGLPGGLDAIGERLTGAGKDATGSKVMKMLATAKHNHLSGETIYPIGTDAAWNLLLRYNVIDVQLLERVYHETKDFGEADVLQVDTIINQRGIAVDFELVEMLRATWHHAEREACEEVSRLTHGALDARNIRSVPQVQEWLRGEGLDLASLDKHQVARLIATPEEFIDDSVDDTRIANVVEVLRLRQVATSVAAGKLASLWESVRNGRAADMLVYHGAGPGRWSGRGFQPQNLGRGVADVDVEECLAALESHRSSDGIGSPGYDVAATLQAVCPAVPLRDILSTLTRPVFYAPPGKMLLIADYASIEARGIAWIAGDDKLLDAFREDRDPYCEMASTVFGRPITKHDRLERHVGKTLVLGCGYGMSGTKYGVYAKQNNLDLASLGIAAADCVKAYRERHKPIKQLWYALGDAALEVVANNAVADVGRCHFAMSGRHFVITLPSGRSIVYRNARVEMLVPIYCKMLGLPEVAKPTVVYEHPRNYTKSIYGGLIAENIVQGTARDLLATALVRCEPAGLPIVLHVHDEIVCEVESNCDMDVVEDLRHLLEVMVDPPPWAAGFPIGVEGFVSPRYVKLPFKGFLTIKGESKCSI